MKPAVAVLYADACGAALVDALKAWRAEYAPSAAYEELLALHIGAVEVKTRILPAGRAQILVAVEGNRQYTNDDYWYEATAAAGELKLEAIRD